LRAVPPLSARPRRAVPALVALVLALTALVGAGCGSGASGGNEKANPAEVAPKNSLVWITAQIRPQGSQQTAVNAIAQKVLGVNDPGKRIEELLNQQSKNSKSKFSYADDIKPWLGRRAGVAVTSLGATGSSSQAALIVASKDNGKAQSAIDKLADSASTKAAKKDYQGVSYRVSARKATAVGLVKDFVVVGSEAGFKAVVDASKGDGLTKNATYQSASQGSDAKLGFGFVDTQALVSALSAQGRIPGGGVGLQSLFGAAGRPITATLNATPQNLVLEAISGLTAQAKSKPNSLVPDLPGDSWVAVGLPNFGAILKQTLTQIGSGVGAGVLAGVEQQIRAQTGLDLNRDILPSLGEMAVFARGNSILTVGGGVVIQTPDPAAARRVLDKLAPLIRRQAKGAVKVVAANVAGASGFKVTTPKIPGGINAVLKGNRLVIAYTDGATRAALAPTSKLGNSPEFQQASASLGGGQPALYVAFAPIAQLAAAASPQKAAQIRQYLGAFSSLVAGTRVQGNQQVGRFVLNLK
jgi:hypothetical protein